MNKPSPCDYETLQDYLEASRQYYQEERKGEPASELERIADQAQAVWKSLGSPPQIAHAYTRGCIERAADLLREAADCLRGPVPGTVPDER